VSTEWCPRLCKTRKLQHVTPDDVKDIFKFHIRRWPEHLKISFRAQTRTPENFISDGVNDTSNYIPDRVKDTSEYLIMSRTHNNLHHVKFTVFERKNCEFLSELKHPYPNIIYAANQEPMVELE
jgi:hypothetical protein